MFQGLILRVHLREIVFSTFSPNRERTWVRFPFALQMKRYHNPGLQYPVTFHLHLIETLQYRMVIKDQAILGDAEVVSV